MHAVLARPGTASDFAPEAATSADTDRWARGALEQVAAAFEALARVHAQVEPEVAASIDHLVAQRAALEAAIPELAKAGLETLKTRVHGDFHLGQILAAQGDAYLIDFEGEPAKSLAERRAKSAPMRDVAGLLRSFDYAAATVERSAPASSDRAVERRSSMLARFMRDSTASFVDAYRTVAAEAAHPWVSAQSWDQLLSLFLIEKSAYEICYETANRPGWIGIPLGGLLRLCDAMNEGGSDVGAE